MKNREIKFRAWNPDNKNHPMVEDALFRCDARELLKGEGFYKNWILMQYTGLKDKNGKEIYEGDIVKWANGKDAVDEVIYSGDRFLLHALGAPSLAKISIDCEIIGNIYENPELTNWK